MWPDIPSGPLAFFGFIFRMRESISSSLIAMLFIRLSVRYWKPGSLLVFRMGLHWFEKNSLKSFAFSLQSSTKTLLTKSGGILGALHLFTTLVMIFK